MFMQVWCWPDTGLDTNMASLPGSSSDSGCRHFWMDSRWMCTSESPMLPYGAKFPRNVESPPSRWVTSPAVMWTSVICVVPVTTPPCGHKGYYTTVDWKRTWMCLSSESAWSEPSVLRLTPSNLPWSRSREGSSPASPLTKEDGGEVYSRRRVSWSHHHIQFL